MISVDCWQRVVGNLYFGILFSNWRKKYFVEKYASARGIFALEGFKEDTHCVCAYFERLFTSLVSMPRVDWTLGVLAQSTQPKKTKFLYMSCNKNSNNNQYSLRNADAGCF